MLMMIETKFKQSGRSCSQKLASCVAIGRATIMLGFLGFSVAAVKAQGPALGVSSPNTPDSRSTGTLSPSSDRVGSAPFSSSFSSSADSDTASSEARLEAPAVPSAGAMTDGSSSDSTGQASSAGQAGSAGHAGSTGQKHLRPHHIGGNRDGSSRWVVYAGGGLTEPVSNTTGYSYLTENLVVQGGAGYQFSQHFSVPVEFDWAQFGLTRQNLDDQIAILNYISNSNSFDGQLNGSSHIWSVSVEPRYAFRTAGAWDPYVVGGAGFYQSVVNFTIPASLVGKCDGPGGPTVAGIDVCGSTNIGQYTSDAPGFDWGGGLAYKRSDSRMSFYAEARFVFIVNSPTNGVTISNYTQTPYTSTDLYPENNYHAAYIPITVGVRF